MTLPKFVTEKPIRFVHAVILACLCLSVLLAPYGDPSIETCPVGIFYSYCGNLTAGASLVRLAIEASSTISVVYVLLLAAILATIVSAVLTLIIAIPWSEDRGLTGWACGLGLIGSVAPWLMLAPTWAYWIVVGCLWASILVARVRRSEALFRLDSEWADARRAATEEAGRARTSWSSSDNRSSGAPWGPEDSAEGSRARAGRSWGGSGNSDGTGSSPSDAISRKYLDAAAILGVNISDSVEAINAAYRSWAKSLHPDRNPNPKEAEHQMKRINEARDLMLEYRSRHQ